MLQIPKWQCQTKGLLCRGKKVSDIAWFMYGMTGFLFLIAAGQSPLEGQLLS